MLGVLALRGLSRNGWEKTGESAKHAEKRTLLSAISAFSPVFSFLGTSVGFVFDG